MDTNDPFGYYMHRNDSYNAPEMEPDDPRGSPRTSMRGDSPSDESGTPKAPRLPFEGRPGKPCPGAPKKGRAPVSLYDLSGEAPVRRLSFGNAGSQSCDDDDNMVSDSMEEEDCMHEDDEPQQQQQQQWAHIEQSPTQPQQQQQLQLPQQPWVQQIQQQAQQLLQQPQWQQPALHQPPQQQVQQQPLRQQLFREQLQRPSHQLFMGQLQAPQQQQGQPGQWCPLSPNNRPTSNSQAQGSSTPARLFR